MSEIKLNAVEIGVMGHFYAMTHRGHKYADDGMLLELAEPIQRTYPGRNMVCNYGFMAEFDNTVPVNAPSYFVAGTSNVAPVQTDTAMADVAGIGATGYVSSELIDRNIDPAAGPLFRKYRFRRTFAPGTFGASPVNLARGGIVKPTGNSNTNAALRSGALCACGLYRDASGNPTTITVLPDEYLDQIWEYTEYLEDRVEGAVMIDVDGVPTNFSYTIRPLAIFSSVWGGTDTLPAGVGPIFIGSRRNVYTSAGANSSTRIGYRGPGLVEPSEDVGKAPAMVPDQLPGSPTSASPGSYVLGQNSRSYAVNWSPTQGNAPGGLANLLKVVMGAGNGGAWQILFDPPLPKTAKKQMSLTFQLAMANMP